jgi:ABC-type enterochelin transport system substrate-binding protein
VILKKIQENCRYSIKENLEEGKKNLLPYLNNFSPMKGVFVNGTLDELDFEKVELNNQAIIAFIKASGKMSVSIDGME